MSPIITNICPCTEFVNYNPNAFITQATLYFVPKIYNFFENKNHYCPILDICVSSKTSGETDHKENISKPGRGGDINESTLQATVVGNISNGLNRVKKISKNDMV